MDDGLCTELHQMATAVQELTDQVCLKNQQRLIKLWVDKIDELIYDLLNFLKEYIPK